MLDSQGSPLKFGDEVLLHGTITGMSSRGDGTTILTVRGLDLGGKNRSAPIYAIESDMVRLFNSPAPAPAVAPTAQSAYAAGPSLYPTNPAPMSAATSEYAGPAAVSPAPAPNQPADAASLSPTTPTASTAAPTDEQAKASAVATPAVAEPAVK